MNLQQQEQFYQMVTRLRANSRAASTRVTEMTNGLLVSKPELINLQEYAKSAAASVLVNKLREILRFQNSNGRP